MEDSDAEGRAGTGWHGGQMMAKARKTGPFGTGNYKLLVEEA